MHNTHLSIRNETPVWNDEMSFNQMEHIAKLLNNTASLMSRAWTQRDDGDTRRSIDDDCGYMKNIRVNNYKFMYDRFGIAERVVNVEPMESWKGELSIYETDDLDEETPFEKAVDELAKGLRGNSKYEDEGYSCLWGYLMKADILSGIGHFGVIFLGFDDQRISLADPVEPREGMKLLFMEAFDETMVDIADWEKDVTNPRYGQPTAYNISFTDPSLDVDTEIPALESTKVHWTRVIHIADNTLNNSVIAVPRMRPVYNHLYDLRKLFGGSGEMYWKGAFPGTWFETHPQLGPDVRVNMTSLRSQMEQMTNSLQRWGVLNGMTANQMAPQVVDPTPQINAGIEAICIQKAIPKRIFIGSAPGGLGAKDDHDQDMWIDRMKFRRGNVNGPKIIAPFFDRLIMLKVLPEPESYKAVWKEVDTTSATDKAMIAVQRTEALSKYVAGGVDQLISPVDYLTRELGFTSEEAEEIVESAIGQESIFEPEEEEIPNGDGGSGQSDQSGEDVKEKSGSQRDV